MSYGRTKKFLSSATAIPGLPGFEARHSALVQEAFRAYTDDVWCDAMGNVYARMGGRGPRVWVSAHFDGLGLMVRQVEEDGFLGIGQLGGFDARTLPGREVTVHGRGGDYYGIIGAKPPHVLSADDMKKVLGLEDLYVDIGFAPEKVKELVRPGDTVSINQEMVCLQDDVVSGRALDDRAGIAAMLYAMKALKKRPCHAEVVFCASAQEEVGAYGAMVGAYATRPDMAIAIDVNHAKTPAAPKHGVVPYDRPSVTRGVTVDRRIGCALERTAADLGMKVSVDVAPGGHTGTDADTVALTRAGVPSGVLSLPLKYMHTTVECIKLSTIRQCGRLLGEFLRQVDDDWEEWPCE